jgi:hypothetical protein
MIYQIIIFILLLIILHLYINNSTPKSINNIRCQNYHEPKYQYYHEPKYQYYHEPKYQLICNVNKHLQRNCYWQKTLSQ